MHGVAWGAQMHQFYLECIDLTAGAWRGVPQVVAHIGCDGFHGQLLSFLHDSVGAEHCATFVLNQEKPKVIGAMSLDGHAANQQIDLYLNKYGRLDPTISRARGCVISSMARPRSAIGYCCPARVPASAYCAPRRTADFLMPKSTT